MLCLVVGGGLLAWSALRQTTYVAPTPHAPRAHVDAAAATQTLTRFEHAVRDGDVAAARALAPRGDDRAADLLAGVVANARGLRVGDFTLRYVDDDGAPGADGTWTADVDATWRFRGFDTVLSSAEVRADLVDDGGRVALSGFAGGDITPVWLSGPAQVRRTASTLVLVDGSPAEADAYAEHARAAVPVVRRVLPDWHGGLVVEVPASSQALEQALGADAGTYDQIAAVTTSADGSHGSRAAVHVFVNPEVFGGLKPTGAQVVMSHEATHVATGAWDSTTPLWLLEGFGDYVALRDSRLPVQRSASQIIAEVRRDGPPRTLPDAAAFGTQAPHLGATYESAWLACRLIAEQAGQQRLVAFYRAVDAGRPLGAALRSTTGMSLAGLTGQWRTLLRDLAG